MKNIKSIVIAIVFHLFGRSGKLLKEFHDFFCNLFLMLVVGCVHRRLSRPYTIGGKTYCLCRNCGAYRLYDLEKMKFYGTYFYRFPMPTGVDRGLSVAAGPGINRFSLAAASFNGRLKQPV